MAQSHSTDLTDSVPSAGERLRAAGLRSTPQRRAILTAFSGGAGEHLSADEIYARAALDSPDLGRGTVYATLAEFTESGLLAAIGTPEPVRYETNVAGHAHLRCRDCLRIFDVEAPEVAITRFTRAGHRVEEITVQAEGICAECRDYSAGLAAGVATIHRDGPPTRLLGEHLAVAAELDTPVGTLLVAATSDGVARVAFPEHGDVAFLRGLIGAEATPAAHEHLQDACTALERYFGPESVSPVCAIDWEAVGEAAEPLRAVMSVPVGARRPYHAMEVDASLRHAGEVFGANPVPILTPCHRVMLGAVLPATFVGGITRRTWLLDHERQPRKD